MNNILKLLILLLTIGLGVLFYRIDYNIDLLSDENTIFLMGIGAAVCGILLSLIFLRSSSLKK